MSEICGALSGELLETVRQAQCEDAPATLLTAPSPQRLPLRRPLRTSGKPLWLSPAALWAALKAHRITPAHNHLVMKGPAAADYIIASAPDIV